MLCARPYDLLMFVFKVITFTAHRGVGFLGQGLVLDSTSFIYLSHVCMGVRVPEDLFSWLAKTSKNHKLLECIDYHNLT